MSDELDEYEDGVERDEAEAAEVDEEARAVRRRIEKSPTDPPSRTRHRSTRHAHGCWVPGEGDGDVDVEEMEEAGPLLDDPEKNHRSYDAPSTILMAVTAGSEADEDSAAAISRTSTTGIVCAPRRRSRPRSRPRRAVPLIVAASVRRSGRRVVGSTDMPLGGSCVALPAEPRSASGSVRTRLRHAFITAALDAGVPLRDVQEAASHADRRTTMRYNRGRQSLDRHATYIRRHLRRRRLPLTTHLCPAFGATSHTGGTERRTVEHRSRPLQHRARHRRRRRSRLGVECPLSPRVLVHRYRRPHDRVLVRWLCALRGLHHAGYRAVRPRWDAGLMSAALTVGITCRVGHMGVSRVARPDRRRGSRSTCIGDLLGRARGWSSARQDRVIVAPDRRRRLTGSAVTIPLTS